MSIATSRAARIATIVAVVALAIAAALATTSAATDVADAPPHCGSLALAALGSAGALGLWAPLPPRTTTPDADGNCPEGYEPAYETTVCTFAPDGTAVACAVQTVCVPVQQDPPDSLSGAS